VKCRAAQPLSGLAVDGLERAAWGLRLTDERLMSKRKEATCELSSRRWLFGLLGKKEYGSADARMFHSRKTCRHENKEPPQ
jgi:hypothetical protein